MPDWVAAWWRARASTVLSWAITAGSAILFWLAWYWVSGASAWLASLFLIIAFVHETGHMLAARGFSVKCSLPVFLPLIGAFVLLDADALKRVSAHRKALILLAGPIPGILVGLAILLGGIGERFHLLWVYGMLSLIINIGNLLPIPPLDGGQICLAYLKPGVLRRIFRDVGLVLVMLVVLKSAMAIVYNP